MVASEKVKKQARSKPAKPGKATLSKAKSEVVDSKSLAEVKDYALIIEPVLTEKASALEGKNGASVVAFRVQRGSSKLEIKAAIERIFKVQVASVRTINVLGKFKRAGRSFGRRASSKKAYVTLKPGSTIDIVEGV